MIENKIGSKILDCAYKVHTELGPGLLESTYETCLEHELIKAGLKVDRQKEIPVYYDGMIINAGYRVDLLVENRVIIENKAVHKMNDLYFAQLLTYLKLSDKRLGYLINWNVRSLKDGIKRVIN